MVLAPLIIIFLILVIGIPNITGAFANLAKTPEQKKKEEEKQKLREDEGLVTTAIRIFAGDEVVDAQKVQNATIALEKIKIAQAKQAGFSSVEAFEIAKDTNRDPFKFNPKGIVGFGLVGVNKQGLPDTPENRKLVEDLVKSKTQLEIQQANKKLQKRGFR